MILIYSKDVDDFVNQVIDFLDEDFIRLGNRDAIDIDEISLNGYVKVNVGSDFFDVINFQEIRKIWFNGGVVNSGNTDYENECYQTLIDSVLTSLPADKIGRIFPEFETNKLHASLEAQKQGFKVPETLITGSKQKLGEFYIKFKNQGGIVCKRIIDAYYYQNSDFIYNFNTTFSVDSNLMQNIPDEFAISLFQRRILAEFEVRVIYIQGVFYAMSVHTFDDKIDYRVNLNASNDIRTIPFALPEDVKEKLERVFKQLDLNYGSADLMFLKGEFYFLEINPSGQVSFVNEACNYYIEKEFSKLLQNG